MEIEEGVIRRGQRSMGITLRKLNSIIGLLLIQNNSYFKSITKTSLPASVLSSSSIVYVLVYLAQQFNILQIADVALRLVFLLFLLCF